MVNEFSDTVTETPVMHTVQNECLVKKTFVGSLQLATVNFKA